MSAWTSELLYPVVQTIWKNSGAVFIPGLASGINWLDTSVPVTQDAGFIAGDTNSTVALWRKIDVSKARRLKLQLSSKILEVGGLGALTVDTVQSVIVAFGVPYEEKGPHLSVPYLATVAPHTVDLNTASLSRRYGGMTVWALANSYSSDLQTCDSQSVSVQQGLFNNIGAVPLVNAINSWSVELSERPYAASLWGATTRDAELNVETLQTVWIAMAISHTIAGTFATSRIAAALRAIKYVPGSALEGTASTVDVLV